MNMHDAQIFTNRDGMDMERDIFLILEQDGGALLPDRYPVHPLKKKKSCSPEITALCVYTVIPLNWGILM